MNKGEQLFAVVDIETTGGKPSETKITEIAIVISDGQRILQEYSSLVNPHRKIDWYVTKLTGITDEMVSKAPNFEDIYDEIRSLLDGKIFVAHNVDFDYNIVKREFLELGKPLDNKKLCTVKSARKVYSDLSSYSLGNLATYLGIPLDNAHRALEDTRATANLLHKILEKADIDFLYSEIKHQNFIVDIPAHWLIQDTNYLDNFSGVMYFLNEEREFLYIDYSANFQKSIYSILHLAHKKDAHSMKVVSQTKEVILSPEKNTFKAELKALNEIQLNKPRFNKPFKRQNDLFCVYLKQDEKGLFYLTISRTKNLIEEIQGPCIFSATFRNAEKLKDKFNHSPEISTLAVLKKQIHVDEGLLMEVHRKQYNDAYLGKLFKEFCCSMKEGYYIFDIYGENEVDALYVKDYYLHSWGQGRLKNNEILDFKGEFNFDSNQKITRRFLNILPKTSYKTLSISPFRI